MATYNAYGNPYSSFFNRGFENLANAGANMWGSSQNALANVYDYGAQLEAARLRSENQLKAQQQALANQLALGQGSLGNQLALGKGSLGNQSSLINGLFGGSGGGLQSLFRNLFGGSPQTSSGGAQTGYRSPAYPAARSTYTMALTYGMPAQSSLGQPGFRQPSANPTAAYNRQFVPRDQLPAYDMMHGTQGMA